MSKCYLFITAHGVFKAMILKWFATSSSSGRPRFDPWVGKISWRRKWQPTPVFLPGKSHGRRSLVGYCPWSRRESDTTEQLHFHFSLSSSGPRCVRTLHYEESWVALHGMAYSFTELCKPLCHDKAVIHDTVNK